MSLTIELMYLLHSSSSKRIWQSRRVTSVICRGLRYTDADADDETKEEVDELPADIEGRGELGAV